MERYDFVIDRVEFVRRDDRRQIPLAESAVWSATGGFGFATALAAYLGADTTLALAILTVLLGIWATLIRISGKLNRG